MLEDTKIQNSTKPSFPLKEGISYIGRVSVKNEVKTFGILDEDRRKHIYLLGKTGMGKSTFLENLVLQDIHMGKGVCFIDPHGDSSEYILQRIPKDRVNDLVYFNPADLENPIGFNVLERQNGEEKYLIVSGLMQIFEHIWSGTWSSRMEYILSNTLFALMEEEDTTLLGIVRMLTDNQYRDYIIKKIQNPTVKNFWIKEFAAFNDKYRTEAIAPILNKIGQFFSSEITLNMLGQSKSTINLREIMDSGKILIVNLSKGKVGEVTMSLLGSLLITKLQLAAMSRVDLAENERKDFYLYVDEFQNFTTDSFATILSEARKYRLCLTIAHQYIKQLEETDNVKVKNAIFGNVGTMATFAVGADDAYKLAQEFAPIFTEAQLVALNKYQIAIKLAIKGRTYPPFLAQTLEPLFADPIIPLEFAEMKARENYTVKREVVRKEISEWMNKEFGLSTLKKTQFNHLIPDPIKKQTNFSKNNYSGKGDFSNKVSEKNNKSNANVNANVNTTKSANNLNNNAVNTNLLLLRDKKYPENKSFNPFSKYKNITDVEQTKIQNNNPNSDALSNLKKIINKEIEMIKEKNKNSKEL
jgi:Type IV secretion-system coupling protein DNA-binding domain